MVASTLVDLVKILSLSSGTGAFSLGSAVPGFRGTEALVDGATYSYSVQSGSNFEAGKGVYLSATGTLVRTPQTSSRGGATVPFEANVQISFTALAQDFAIEAVLDAAIAAGSAAGTAAAEAGLADITAEVAALSDSVDDKLPLVGGSLSGPLSLPGLTARRQAPVTEGGEIVLERPATTSLAGNISVDISSDRFRVFENGGTGRGFYVDLLPLTGGAGTNLLSRANHTGTQAASTVTQLQPGTGGVSRLLSAIVGDRVSVKGFGALGDGATNDNAAMLAAQAFSSNVYWPEGTYVLSAVPDIAKSWGPGVCMVSGNRVYLRPTAEPASAILADIFGLAKDGTTDDAPASQRAIDFGQSLRLKVIFPPSAPLFLGTGLTAKQGRAATGDPFLYAVDIDFNNCTLYPSNGVRALDVVPRCLLADASTSRGSANMTFGNVTFDGSKGNSSSRAYRIGATGYHFSPFKFGQIHDILVHLFSATTDVVEIVEARHLEGSRVVVRAGVVKMSATASGSFCGDTFWRGCEFTGTGGNECFTIRAIAASAPKAVCRGIHLTDCVSYGPGTAIQAGGNSDIGDIWFNGHQFEGPYDGSVGGRGMDIYADGAGARVFAVFVPNAYFAGLKGPAVYARSVNSGDVRGIQITDFNMAASTVSAATAVDANCNSLFAFSGVKGFTVNGTINGATGDTNTLTVNIQSSVNFEVVGIKGQDFTGINAGVIAAGTADKGLIDNIFLPTTTANVAVNFGSGTQITIGSNIRRLV